MNFLSLCNFHFPLGNNVKFSILLWVCLLGTGSLFWILLWQEPTSMGGEGSGPQMKILMTPKPEIYSTKNKQKDFRTKVFLARIKMKVSTVEL